MSSLDQLKEVNLVRIIDDEILTPRFSGDKSSPIRPSSVSVEVKGKYLNWIEGSCHRQLYYSYKDFPISNPTTSAYVTKTAIWGDLIEEFVGRGLRSAGILESPDPFQHRQSAMYNNELGMSGHLDFIVKHPLRPGARIIVECKSFHGYYAKQQLVTGKSILVEDKKTFVFPQPKPHHLLQVSTYLHHFRDKFIGAKLLYIARDDPSAHNEFNITIEKESSLDGGEDHLIYVDGFKQDWFSVNGIFQRFHSLKKAIEEDKLPNRDYNPVYDEETLTNMLKETEESLKGPGVYLIAKGQAEEQLALLKGKKKKGVFSGHWRCNSCPWRTTCTETK